MPAVINIGISKATTIELTNKGNILDLDIYFTDEHIGGVCLTKKEIDELVYQLLKRRRRLG